MVLIMINLNSNFAVLSIIRTFTAPDTAGTRAPSLVVGPALLPRALPALVIVPVLEVPAAVGGLAGGARPDLLLVAVGRTLASEEEAEVVLPALPAVLLVDTPNDVPGLVASAFGFGTNPPDVFFL